MSSSHSGKQIKPDSNLLIIFSVTLMAILGVSSLTPAFPKIGETFNITLKEVGLLITIFTLPGIFLTPVLGILSDRYGRKIILVPSLLLFGVAGGCCYFAADFQRLLILGFRQGAGAASLGSLNVTILGDIYSGKNRVAAMGYNASVISVGTAGFPLIGGVLATFGWHYPFLMPWLDLEESASQ